MPLGTFSITTDKEEENISFGLSWNGKGKKGEECSMSHWGLEGLGFGGGNRPVRSRRVGSIWGGQQKLKTQDPGRL